MGKNFYKTPILTKAFNSLNRALKRGVIPSLAVLGPRGSGTSELLSRINQEISLHDGLPEFRSIAIDLKGIPIASSEQMLSSFIDKLSQGHASLNHQSPNNAFPKFNKWDLQAAILEILKSTKEGLLLSVDHFDRVPRYFARFLANIFKEISDNRDTFIEFHRFGMVVAGSISLFDLRQEVASPFLQFDPLLLPLITDSEQQDLVEEYLERHEQISCDKEIIDLLAKETGGEPSFLNYTFHHLREKRWKIHVNSLKRAFKEISSLSSIIPELQDIALHIYLNRDLREIVLKLNSKQPIVALRDNVADIDKFQLLGCVVADKFSNPPTYRFRNKIVESYIGKLLKYFDSSGIFKTTNNPKNLSSNQSTNRTQTDFHLIKKIHEYKTSINHASGFWDHIKNLNDLWNLLVKKPYASIFISLSFSNNIDKWWLNSNNRTLVVPHLEKTIPEAVLHASNFALKHLSPCVEQDANLYALAIPVDCLDVFGVVNVALKRGEIGEFSERSLCHWISLIEEIGEMLIRLSLAEVGAETIKGNIFKEHRTNLPDRIIQPTTSSEAVKIDSHPHEDRKILQNKGKEEIPVTDISDEVIENLAKIICEQAHTVSHVMGIKGFFKQLIQKSQLPKEWKEKRIYELTDNPDINCRGLIAWAINQKRIPGRINYTTLGAILESIHADLGLEDASYICGLLSDYKLIDDQEALIKLQQKSQL